MSNAFLRDVDNSSIDPSRTSRSLIFFLFTVCPILFFTDLTRNPYYTQITLLNIFLPLLWLVWLLEAVRARELFWVRSPMDLPLLSVLLFSIGTWLYSMVAHPAFVKSIYSEGSKAAVFLIVNTWMVYAAAQRVRGTSLVRSCLWLTYVVCFVAAFYGIAQYFGVEFVWPTRLNPYGSRPVSTFGNPNFMSSFLVVALPVMMADYLYRITNCSRAFLFICIHMTFAVLLATLTRSSWGGFGAALLVMAWGARQSEVKPAEGKYLLFGTLLASALAWPSSDIGYHPIVVERLLEAKLAATEAYGSVFQRLLIWLAAWGIVEDHPFVGKGWGCFELFYPFYQGQLLFLKNLSARTHANNAHNEIMEYWSQIGTLGLGLVIWMWIVFFRSGASIARRAAGSWKMMVWAMMGGVFGMLVDNLLNVSVHFAVPAFLFWWWVGVVMSMDVEALQIYRISLGPLWRKGAVAIVSLAIVCLIGRAAALWAGEVNFFKGFKLSKGGVDLLSASRSLERAYFWHHLEVNNNYELGNVYARMGDREKALFMYQRALDANAGYDEIYFNRATLLMQSGRFEESIDNYHKCLAINPLSQPAYNALAGLYFKDVSRYGVQVEALYLKGLQVYPNDKDMWNNLGYYYTQVGNWDQAINAYQNAIKIDPQFDLARKNLSYVEAKRKTVRGDSRR